MIIFMSPVSLIRSPANQAELLQKPRRILGIGFRSVEAAHDRLAPRAKTADRFLAPTSKESRTPLGRMEAIALWMPATDGTLALQGMNYRD